MVYYGTNGLYGHLFWSKCKDKLQDLTKDRAKDQPLILKPTDAQASKLGKASQGKPFSCAKCGLGFTQKSYVNHHLRHGYCLGMRRDLNPEGPIKCPTCDKTFRDASWLSRHLKVTKDCSSDNANLEPKSLPPKKELFQCKSCKKPFSLKSSLQRHQVNGACKFQQSEVSVTSPESDGMLDSQGKLSFHKNRRRDNNPASKNYFCARCNSGFKYRWNLLRHLTAKNCSKPFETRSQSPASEDSVADKEIDGSIMMYLKKEIQIADDMVADKAGVEASEDLTSLENDVSCAKPFICNTCGVGFTHQRSHKRHVSDGRCTPVGRNGRKVCIKCGYRFKTDESYKLHVAKDICTYRTRKPYRCKKCGAVFKLLSDFFKHKASHQVQKLEAKREPNQSLSPNPNMTETFDDFPIALDDATTHKSNDESLVTSNNQSTCNESATKVKEKGLTGDVAFSCCFCDFSCGSKDEVRVHMADQHLM